MAHALKSWTRKALVGHIETDVDVALSAAAAGAAVVRAAYGTELTRHTKSGSDFATDADFHAERAVLDVIAGARPDDARIGEETGAVAGSGSRRWLVDPLCGTLNFAAQTHWWQSTWRSWKGRRASRASRPTRSPTSCSGLTGITHALAAMVATSRCSRQHSRDWSVSTATVRQTGLFWGRSLSLTRLCAPRSVPEYCPRHWQWRRSRQVAAGRQAAYISDGLFIDNVHFAAGIALCRRPGCLVTDLAGGPLHKGRGLIAAADADTHERLVELTRPHLKELLHPPERPHSPDVNRSD